jgi:Fe-S protein assembly co-chaperone HscB
MSRAVTVNEAARMLRDDLSRANALLRIHGIDASADAPPTLLMEVMELRESIADAKRARDRAALETLGDAVQRMTADALAEMTRALDGGAASDALAPLVRLRYYRRFLDEHQLALDELS